jgi:hypothetical protein
MRRMTLIALLILVLVTALTGVGTWQVRYPAVDRFVVVPASTPIVSYPQPGVQQITYTTRNANWKALIETQLEETHRGPPASSNPYQPADYYRQRRLLGITLTEMIAVRGTTNQAVITIRRRVHFFGISIP